MRLTRKFKRRGVVAIAVMAVVPTLSTVSVDPVSADRVRGNSGANKPLRDGNWTGTMAVGAIVDASSGGAGIVISGGGDGGFDLTLAGGEASGVYTLDINTDLVVNGPASGSVDQVGTIVGTFQGTASGPILVPGQASFVTTGKIGDVDINRTTNVPGGTLTSSALVIAASSCSTASGTWAHELKTATEATGASANIEGSWAATYAGADADATNAVLKDILNRGQAIYSQWLKTAVLDISGLETVLLDAERFAASAPVGDKCTPGPDANWASPLAGLISQLLNAMATSDATTTEVMRFGLAAGVRTGVLPSGPEDALGGKLYLVVVTMLDEAIAAGSKFDIVNVLIAADSMGWVELVAKANEALKGLK